MKILILGAGKMGTFFCDLLSADHSVAVYDPNPEALRFTYGVERFSNLDEIDAFAPEMVINAATVRYTIDAFNRVLPHLPAKCILSDIASVKTGLPEFYATCGNPFASSHPMFGPTFASLSNLSNENAIIISEGDHLGRIFFRDLYQRLGLNVVEYTFEQHDLTIAYSLSIPLAATILFPTYINLQDHPAPP
ncbi:MAG: prephenate dehydrogenase/arogenate dehydrogenase family protein [Paramuribaculum sp.]|nr:prephenate dehydrogenase/arogenate dehydrogenase family protein [Paramuribaculum sp.]